MSEVLENIKSRRSVKKYKPDMVPREIIEQIVEAGTYAPTGMNKQSPIILAVTKKEIRDIETKALLEKLYGGSLQTFISEYLMYQNLSVTECEQLERVLKQQRF